MNIFIILILGAILGGLYWLMSPGSQVQNQTSDKDLQADAFAQVFLAQQTAAESYHSQNLIAAGNAQVFPKSTLNDSLYVVPHSINLLNNPYNIASFKICFSGAAEVPCYLGTVTSSTLNPSATHYIITYTSETGSLTPENITKSFANNVQVNLGTLSAAGTIIPFGGHFTSPLTIPDALMTGANSLAPQAIQIPANSIVYVTTYTAPQILDLWNH